MGMRKNEKNKVPKPSESKILHPWRLCPAGEHWVKTHPLTIPPSKKNPQGGVTIRRGHCARNPTGKDQLYPDEIKEIAKQNFSKVKERPCPTDLGFSGANKGSQYDELIAGWTKYWNDIFRPEPPLDPNVVKALIATESRFDHQIWANPKDKNSARGLMQITNETRKILSDETGELKDHFLTLTREDLIDPSVNICAGIRWLFRKRAIASDILKRTATWDEAVAEFKGVRMATKTRGKELLERFNNKLEALKKCGQS